MHLNKFILKVLIMTQLNYLESLDLSQYNLNTTFFLEKISEAQFKVYAEPHLHKALQKKFNYMWEGYRFHPAYKAGRWDGRISLYDYNNELFPIGLLQHFKRYCQEKNLNYVLNVSESEFEGLEIDEEAFPEMLGHIFKEGFNLRDYQEEAVKLALTGGRGVLQLATGAGKSSVLYTLARLLPILTKQSTLLIVPNISLVEQMYSDFEDYAGVNISHIAEKLFGDASIKRSLTNEKPVLITTWQSIMKKPIDFFKRFGSVLVDETHTSKSNQLQDILQKCTNARFRIGLTGTLNKNELDRMTVFSMLGDVLMVKKSKELQDMGILSKIKIINMMVDYPKKYRESIRSYSYQSECNLIETIPQRNNVIKNIIKKIKGKTELNPESSPNILILVNKREHLDKIWSALRRDVEPEGWKISIIHGDIPATKRESIRVGMEERGGQILIATFGTVSTGVNIKRLHHVIFASSYKSEIKVLQSIGRGLRLYSDKEQMFLWDIVDDIRYESGVSTFKNKLFQHWLERCKFYKEQEFPTMDYTIAMTE